MRRLRLSAVAVLVLGLTLYPPCVARADIGVELDKGGTTARLSESQVGGLPGGPGSGVGVGDRFEYRFEVHCSGAGWGRVVWGR